MNVAMKHEAIPALYQLIQGVDRVGYDRYDDLWSGLFAKKICDHLGLPIVVNGRASIIHTRASDTAANLRKEQAGYELNDALWERLRGIELRGDNVVDCYAELTWQLDPAWFGEHGGEITKAMIQWVEAL
jgi:hypothetical protein